MLTPICAGQNRASSEESHKKPSGRRRARNPHKKWRTAAECRTRSGHSYDPESPTAAEPGVYSTGGQSNAVSGLHGCESDEPDQSDTNGGISEHLSEPIDTGTAASTAFTSSDVLHSVTYRATAATTGGDFVLQHGSLDIRG